MHRRGCIVAAIVVGIIALLTFVSAGFLGQSIQSTVSDASNSIDHPSGLGPVDSGDPDEVIYCELLRDRSTRAQCDYLQLVWSKLEVGTGGVDVPDSIVRGESGTVSFAISRSADLSSTKMEDVLGAKADQQVRLKIGRRMAAQLQGDGFTIAPTGLQQRDLFVGDAARWDWQVTPDKARRYRLLLSAYVVVQAADGSSKESLLKTLELPLSVKVTWGQRIGDLMDDSEAWLTRGTNWIKALTVFLISVGGLIALFRRKKPSDE